MRLLVKWFGASSAPRTRRPKRLRYLGPVAGAVNAPPEYPRALVPSAIPPVVAGNFWPTSPEGGIWLRSSRCDFAKIAQIFLALRDDQLVTR